MKPVSIRVGRSSFTTHYLNFGLQDNGSISGVCKSEDSTELVQCKVPNISDFQLGGLKVLSLRKTVEWSIEVYISTHLCPHFQLNYLDAISDNWWFITLVKGCIKHLNSIGVKLVREPRPLKSERHEKEKE